MMNRTAVLIPHFNNPNGLRASLNSIAEQDAADVVVVDDGSREVPREDDLRSWVPGEREVHLIRLGANRGIEVALNTGLDQIVARGYEFVARLDCGDCNVGLRFTRQMDWLDEHSNVILLGGAAQFVDPQGAPLFVRTMPTTHVEIAAFMQVNCAFMHPTVMFRATALDVVGRYPDLFPAAEDYAFFWTFLDFGEVANLPDVLITYEVDPRGISRSRRRTQLRSRLAVQTRRSDGSLRAQWGMFRTRLLLALPVGAVDAVKARRYGQP